jgi:hypothetical protein
LPSKDGERFDLADDSFLDLPDQSRAVADASKAHALESHTVIREFAGLRDSFISIHCFVSMKAAELRVFFSAGSVRDKEATIHHALNHGFQPSFRKPVAAAGAFTWIIAGTVIASMKKDANGFVEAIQGFSSVTLMPVNGDLVLGRDMLINL